MEIPIYRGKLVDDTRPLESLLALLNFSEKRSKANLTGESLNPFFKLIMKEDLIEKLLETWGAKEKLNHKDTALPALALLGYKVGHQWASRQKEGDLLSRFEEFYTDLINNRLTKKRYNMLYEELDPASIIAEMPDTINEALEDPKVAEAMLGNYHFFENGIVWGLMSVIRRIISDGKST